jgi:hypothetical protein
MRICRSPLPPLFVILAYAWSGTAVAQDGNYSGNRYLAPGLPSLCKTTTISGSISGGLVNLNLAYNGALLSGRLARNGSVKLSGSAGRYRYYFTGKLSGKKLSGTWYAQPRDCWGRWSVLRR